MARRSKVLLASLVVAIVVAGLLPALAAAAPLAAADASKVLAVKSLAIGPMVEADDDIPGVALPPSPFSATLQAPADELDVYAVPLTAGQSFYMETESGALGTTFPMMLLSTDTPSLNEMSFEHFVGFSYLKDEPTEALMYTAEQTGTYYVLTFDWADPPLSSPGTYTATYGYPAKQPVITPAFGSQSLAYGRTTTLTGTVSFEGAPLADTTVVLLAKAYGAEDWTYAREVTTTAEGVFGFTLKPSQKTAYMLWSFGDFEYKEAISTPKWVSIKAWVGNPAAPSVMYANRAASVWAYLKPRHTAGKYPVRIYKERYVNGSWKPYGYTTAKAYNYGTYTKCIASIKLPYRGRWRLKAYHADGGHLGTYSSGYDYVTVK